MSSLPPKGKSGDSTESSDPAAAPADEKPRAGTDEPATTNASAEPEDASEPIGDEDEIGEDERDAKGDGDGDDGDKGGDGDEEETGDGDERPEEEASSTDEDSGEKKARSKSGKKKAVTSGPGDGETTAGGLAAFFRDRYLTLDRRLLGLFRIVFGIFLLVDVLRRMRVVTFFFSNDGILSNHFSLFAPLAKPYFSLLTAFSTPTEVMFAMSLCALVYVGYIVGYRTKLFQILALVAYVSLNVRNLFLENGGCVVMSIVCVWTAFLPLGDRFSVDALVRSMRTRFERKASALNDRTEIEPDRTPVVSLVALAIAYEIAIIYFFNFVHKSGETWRNGEAVHWVLWQNRIATHAADWLRMHEPSWFSPVFTRATLIIEGAAPLLVLSPVFQRWTRTLNFFLISGLHLSIALLMTLGPFSYIMVLINALLLPAHWLDRGAEWLGRNKTRRTVVYDATDAGLHFVARLLARMDLYGCLTFIDSADAARRPEGAPKSVFAVRAEGQKSWAVGTGGIVAAARSLPAGRALALLLDNAAGLALLRVLLRRRARWAETFDLAPGAREDAQGAPAILSDPPTPLMEQWAASVVALRESFAAGLLFTVVLQTSHDNYWLPAKLRFDVPRALSPLITYPRIIQGWSMFSPEAPKQDGTIVVDGVTEGGKHVDPLTGNPPDFDAPLHGPWYQTQFYCDWFLKISFDGNKGYRDEFRNWASSWHRLAGRPAQDRLVSWEMYWVSNDSPPPGQTVPTNIKKKLLIASH
jgi:hypothetical protein